MVHPANFGSLFWLSEQIAGLVLDVLLANIEYLFLSDSIFGAYFQNPGLRSLRFRQVNQSISYTLQISLDPISGPKLFRKALLAHNLAEFRSVRTVNLPNRVWLSGVISRAAAKLACTLAKELEKVLPASCQVS